jgi:hypothetical protein
METAADSGALFTMVTGEPAIAWFNWCLPKSIATRLSGQLRDDVSSRLAELLESAAVRACWPDDIAFLSRVEAPPAFAKLYPTTTKPKTLLDPFQVFCVRLTKCGVPPLAPHAHFRSVCEHLRAEARSVLDRFADADTSLEPFVDIDVFCQRSSAALIRVPSEPVPPTNLVSFDLTHVDADDLFFSDDKSCGLCIVARRRLHQRDLSCVVLARTHAGYSLIGWFHDPAHKSFSSAERRLLADRFAVQRMFEHLRPAFAGRSLELMRDWCHQGHGLAKARAFAGERFLQHVLADSFGADVLLRASARVRSLSSEERIRCLLAVRHNLPERAPIIEQRIFQEWNARALDCFNASRCDAHFGMERIKMLHRAFDATYIFLTRETFEELRFPFVLPALDAPAEQERFIEVVLGDLEAAKMADFEVPIAPFYAQAVRDFKAAHDVRTYPQLLTNALAARLLPSQADSVLSPLAQDNSSTNPHLYDQSRVLYWPTT